MMYSILTSLLWRLTGLLFPDDFVFVTEDFCLSTMNC